MDSDAASAVPLSRPCSLAGLSREVSRRPPRRLHPRELQFAAGTAPLAEPATFAQWLDGVWQQDWVVYTKPPFAGPQQVVAYLGRYTHRIAISQSASWPWRTASSTSAGAIIGKAMRSR